MNPRLVAVSGALAGEVLALASDDPVSLGRDASNRIPISDVSVSRRHCVIAAEGGQCVIRDLDSRNGTYVNELPVRERVLEDAEKARDPFRAASNELNRSLERSHVPYYVATDLMDLGDGVVPTLLTFYVQERGTYVPSTGKPVDVIRVWRLDRLNLRQALLGYTQASEPRAIILLDQIESVTVRAEAQDGDIVYSGAIAAGGEYRFYLHDGDVLLQLPADVSARVHVSTFDGEFTSDFPVRVESFSAGRQFDFVLGGGSALLEIEVFDGEIRLARR